MTFENWLQKQAVSENTMKSLRSNLKQYDKWLQDTFDRSLSEKLYRPNILEYKQYMMNVKKYAPKTINTKILALIKYNEYLLESEKMDHIVVSNKDYVKIEHKLVMPTDLDEKKVDAFRQRCLEKLGIRDYAISTVLAYTGLRVSELCNLELKHMNFKSKEILIMNSKGEKSRISYMSKKVRDAIKQYLEERKHESEYVFVTYRGNKLHRADVNAAFKKVDDTITPHSLRHFCASWLIERGFSITEVAAWMGHASPYVTLQYAKPRKKEILRKLDEI